MRVLVATNKTNGDIPGDYGFCVEGELVYLQDPCARDRRDPDGGCGCGRGFCGTNSHRATTTAMVVDSELSENDLREALRASLVAGGYLPPGYFHKAEEQAILNELLSENRALAEAFPVGSVVRRRLEHYYVRSR